MTASVTLNGFGPHVRFKTKTDALNSKATVKFVTRDTVRSVPLVGGKTTDLVFRAN